MPAAAGPAPLGASPRPLDAESGCGKVRAAAGAGLFRPPRRKEGGCAKPDNDPGPPHEGSPEWVALVNGVKAVVRAIVASNADTARRREVGFLVTEALQPPKVQVR